MLHDKWNTWFMSEEHVFTNHGNLRSPGYVTCINWISQICNEFPVELLINSFEQCGITSSYKCHSALQTVLDIQKTVGHYIDNYKESDDIDGFTDVNLFTHGAEEVMHPLVNNREIDEVDEYNA
jgi:hypothetical protein